MVPHPRRIRTRLTLAFVAVLALVLAIAGFLVYHQFGSGLLGTVDEGLLQNERDFRAVAERNLDPAQLVDQSGEGLLQLYSLDGRLTASSRRLSRARLLTPAQVRTVRRVRVASSTVNARQEGEVRVRAFVLARRGTVAAVGESLALSRRDQHRLAVLLALILPAALALASYAGYQVAGAALRPVEQMRERAAGITDVDLGERLPVPATDDEIERLATTLNALLERLDAALERERRLVSDASHELRTPLTILRAELEVARDRRPDAGQLHAAIDSALEEVGRLSHLSEDLLVLARADQGRLPLRPEPLDVEDLLESAVRRHAPAAERAGRRVSATVGIPGGAVVLADADRAAQALDNLIANALHHGDGTVELEASLAAQGQVAITVRDHGPGYPHGFADRAFGRFSQGDAARSGPHSGLGMAIVAAVTAAQGGTTSAANHPGGGAITTVTLPRA